VFDRLDRSGPILARDVCAAERAVPDRDLRETPDPLGEVDRLPGVDQLALQVARH
jgi:hypothetical protein